MKPNRRAVSATVVCPRSVFWSAVRTAWSRAFRTYSCGVVPRCLRKPSCTVRTETSAAVLHAVADAEVNRLVLDAFAVGILPSFDRDLFPDDLLVFANEEEAELLLGRDFGDERADDMVEIARRYRAVVHCFGTVATPYGRCWQAEPGGSGLGTAGSGDVLSGTIAGFAAMEMDAEQAAVWGRVGSGSGGRSAAGADGHRLPRTGSPRS